MRRGKTALPSRMGGEYSRSNGRDTTDGRQGPAAGGRPARTGARRKIEGVRRVVGPSGECSLASALGLGFSTATSGAGSALIDRRDHARRPRQPATRALADQAPARRTSGRFGPLDRDAAARRSPLPAHGRPQPLPRLGGRGMAPRALQRLAREQLSGLRGHAARHVSQTPELSPLFASRWLPFASFRGI